MLTFQLRRIALTSPGRFSLLARIEFERARVDFAARLTGFGGDKCRDILPPNTFRGPCQSDHRDCFEAMPGPSARGWPHQEHDFALRWRLGGEGCCQFAKFAAPDRLVMFGQFARQRGFPLAENGGEIGQTFGDAAGRFEKDERAGNGRQFGDPLAPSSAFDRQKAFEKRSVGSPATTSAASTAEAPGIEVTAILFATASVTSLKPGSETSGVPASDTSAKAAPPARRAKKMRPHHRGIVLVIGDEQDRNSVMGEKSLRHPRIFGDHRDRLRPKWRAREMKYRQDCRSVSRPHAGPAGAARLRREAQKR